MSKEICESNPNDPRCSCYNVVMRDCTTNPDIPGCKEGNEWKNSLTSVIPGGTSFDSARRIINIEAPDRYYCEWVGACTDDKYKPPEYNDLLNTGRCTWKLNMCASNVNVGESINAKFFRDCSINEVVFTDLDSVYAQDPSVQVMLGLRTGENAALIAAKNKKLQLELRAQGRIEEADRLAKLDEQETIRLEKLDKIRQDIENKNENKKRLLLVLLGAAILISMLILIL
jgi:hypothetical protein